MKKILPISLLILLIAVIIFIIKISQGDDTLNIENPEMASSTDQVTTSVSEDVWLSCDDRTRVKISYTDNNNSATLSFHDDVFSLTKVAGDEAKYTDSAKGLELLSENGKITINQKGTDATVTCQVSA